MIDDKKAIKSLKNMDTKASDARKSFKKFGKAVGVAAVAAGVLAVSLGTVAVKAAADFQKGMANVATLLGGDFKKRIEELGDGVKGLMAMTGQSFEVLQDGLYQVVSAFGDTVDTMAILEVASKAAAAGNATVTDSVNLLSAVVKGYGDTSIKAVKKTSDLAFQTVKLGQTTFPELAKAMGKVIPLAAELTVSEEELFAVMATLTGVTGNTAEVSTQFRGVLQGLMKPTAGMSKAIKGLGYENGNALIEAEGFQGGLKLLTEHAEENGIEMVDLFGSVEGLTAAMALTGPQFDTWVEKQEAMANSSGEAEEAFKIQQESVTASFEKIKGAINVVVIELGDEFLPMVQKALDWVIKNMPKIKEVASDAFNTVGDSIEWVKDNSNWLIPVLGSLLGAFIALKVIGVLTAIMAAYKSMVLGTTGITAALNAVMLANPAVLIALGIGILIGVLIALVMNFDKVKEGAASLWESVSNFFGKIGDFIGDIFSGIKDKIKMPKFTISGTMNPLKWLKEGVPKLNVKWNADGGIFKKPTIFNTGSGLQGVGEAGAEAIMPLSKLESMLNMNNNQIDYKMLAHEIRTSLLGLSVRLDSGALVGQIIPTIDFELGRNADRKKRGG